MKVAKVIGRRGAGVDDRRAFLNLADIRRYLRITLM
jgi:hypothetical protein